MLSVLVSNGLRLHLRKTDLHSDGGEYFARMWKRWRERKGKERRALSGNLRTLYKIKGYIKSF